MVDKHLRKHQEKVALYAKQYEEWEAFYAKQMDGQA